MRENNPREKNERGVSVCSANMYACVCRTSERTMERWLEEYRYIRHTSKSLIAAEQRIATA